MKGDSLKLEERIPKPPNSYSKSFKDPKRIKELDCFTDIGATIADNFKVKMPEVGKSFLGKLN